MNGIMNENGTAKEYDFFKPENDQVDYLLDKVIKDCSQK